MSPYWRGDLPSEVTVNQGSSVVTLPEVGLQCSPQLRLCLFSERRRQSGVKKLVEVLNHR